MRKLPIIKASQLADRTVAVGETIRVIHHYQIDGVAYTGKFQYLNAPSGDLVKCPACGCHCRQLYEAQGRIERRIGLWCTDCQSKCDHSDDKRLIYRKPAKKQVAA